MEGISHADSLQLEQWLLVVLFRTEIIGTLGKEREETLVTETCKDSLSNVKSCQGPQTCDSAVLLRLTEYHTINYKNLYCWTMPRGYLKKETRNVGRKKGRGGSSKKPQMFAPPGKSSLTARQRCRESRCDPKWRDHAATIIQEDVFELERSKNRDSEESIPELSKRTASLEIRGRPPFTRVTECPICFEVKPVLRVMKGCSHESA